MGSSPLLLLLVVVVVLPRLRDCLGSAGGWLVSGADPRAAFCAVFLLRRGVLPRVALAIVSVKDNGAVRFGDTLSEDSKKNKILYFCCFCRATTSLARPTTCGHDDDEGDEEILSLHLPSVDTPGSL
jgi:hypothetical protein